MKCPICHSTKVTTLFPGKDRMFGLSGTFFVRRCLRCDQVFITPFLSQSKAKKYYPSKTYYAYRGDQKPGMLQKLRSYLILHLYAPSFASLLLSFFVHGVPAIPKKVLRGKVLDVGCGTGDTLVLLQQLGWNVFGLEMDTNAVGIAKSRGLTNIRLGAYESLRYYTDDSFDAIRLYHVIEHIPHPMRCFDLLYKKLAPGGELIVGTPNMSSLVAKVFGTYWYNLDTPRHVFLFTPRTLRNMAEQAGFRVQSMEYCSAGGLVGSIQYFLRDAFHVDIDLIHALWCVLLFYPLEWLIDKLRMGDVFVMRMTKE